MKTKKFSKCSWILGLFNKKTNALIGINAEEEEQFYPLKCILPEDLICEGNLPISLNYFESKKDALDSIKGLKKRKCFYQKTLPTIYSDFIEIDFEKFYIAPIYVKAKMTAQFIFQKKNP